jgi:IS30 family transposase
MRKSLRGEFFERVCAARSKRESVMYAVRRDRRGQIPNRRAFSIRDKTPTYENGKEFAGHSLIDQELNITAYFARPFISWQGGSNEKLNGLKQQ